MFVDIYKATNIKDGYIIVPAGTDITTINTDKDIQVSPNKHKENYDINNNVTGSNGHIIEDIEKDGYSIQNAGISLAENE
jgi:hypothetical protein